MHLIYLANFFHQQRHKYQMCNMRCVFFTHLEHGDLSCKQKSVPGLLFIVLRIPSAF